jgi:hypothetical protein
MAAGVTEELREFHRFLTEKLNGVGSDLSRRKLSMNGVDSIRRRRPSRRKWRRFAKLSMTWLKVTAGFHSISSTAIFGNGTTCRLSHEPNSSPCQARSNRGRLVRPGSASCLHERLPTFLMAAAETSRTTLLIVSQLAR